MLTTSLIAKKRDGGTLSADEISYLIRGCAKHQIDDYQMTALAMAICIRGMNAEEITALTTAMLESGQRLPRIPDGPPRVDKHSSGGLGDKVSLILAPLLAAAGMHVPMISGKGLGLTGGTLDKLESIPGFEIHFAMEQTTGLLEKAGCFIISASDEVAPADRRLYALRDVSATVESVGLITASILSKKLAASLDALVMDVKVGSGAFMKSLDAASELASSIVNTGLSAGLPVRALLTDMDQPLGKAVGNAIEVNESLSVLQGAGQSREGHSDAGFSEVRRLTVELASHAIQQVSPTRELQEIRKDLERLLDSGAAMERFERMVSAQHGTLSGPLPLAPAHEITSERSGYLKSIDCPVLGEAIVSLGGGRRVKNDKIVHDVGISVEVRIGDRVEKGQPLAILHAPASRAAELRQSLRQAFLIVEQFVPANPLVLKTM